MQFPITIGLHRSRILDQALLVVALVLGATVLALPAGLPFRLTCLVVICLLAVQIWRRLSPRFSAVRLEKSGQLSVVPEGAEEFLAASLLPGATVHPWLCVARLQSDDEGRPGIVRNPRKNCLADCSTKEITVPEQRPVFTGLPSSIEA